MSDITEKLVEIAKLNPDLFATLEAAYNEIRDLRSKVRGLEWKITTLENKYEADFREAILSAIRNVDYKALNTAIEAEIDLRSE